MKLIKSFEEFSGENRYQLATGETVKLNRNHIHKGVLKYLDDALSTINGGKKFIKKEIKFDHNIGSTYCVKTKDDDDIYYEKRPKRKGKSRMFLIENQKIVTH